MESASNQAVQWIFTEVDQSDEFPNTTFSMQMAAYK